MLSATMNRVNAQHDTVGSMGIMRVARGRGVGGPAIQGSGMPEALSAKLWR